VFFPVRPEQFSFCPLRVLFFPAACFGQVCLRAASDLLCRSRFLRLIHRHLGLVPVRQSIFEAARLYLVWALGSRPRHNRRPARLRCVLLRILISHRLFSAQRTHSPLRFLSAARSLLVPFVLGGCVIHSSSCGLASCSVRFCSPAAITPVSVFSDRFQLSFGDGCFAVVLLEH
jgi:hypothetical protein